MLPGPVTETGWLDRNLSPFSGENDNSNRQWVPGEIWEESGEGERERERERERWMDGDGWMER